MNDHIQQIVATQLTENQAQVFILHHHHHMSFRAIAHHLGLARTTVTDRYDAACRNLQTNGVRFTPAGDPYHEETPTR